MRECMYKSSARFCLDSMEVGKVTHLREADLLVRSVWELDYIVALTQDTSLRVTRAPNKLMTTTNNDPHDSPPCTNRVPAYSPPTPSAYLHRLHRHHFDLLPQWHDLHLCPDAVAPADSAS